MFSMMSVTLTANDSGFMKWRLEVQTVLSTDKILKHGKRNEHG